MRTASPQFRSNRQSAGRRAVPHLPGLAAHGEEFVAHALIRRGCTILARNIRYRGSELDIVATRSDMLYVIEVKTRVIMPARLDELVNRRKRQSLMSGAMRFIAQQRPATWNGIRFDLAVLLVGPPPRLHYFPDILDPWSVS